MDSSNTLNISTDIDNLFCNSLAIATKFLAQEDL